MQIPELRKLAADIVDGKVIFFKVDPRYPLPEGFSMCYEYLTEQTGGGLFFSCRYLTSDQWGNLQPLMAEYRELKERFLNPEQSKLEFR